MKIGKRTGSDLVRVCLEYLEIRKILAWRNNSTGIFDPESKRFRAFVGMRGTGDILGVLPGGRFLSVECKEGSGRLSPDQRLFIDRVNACGGLAVCVRHVNELIEALHESGC